MWYTKDDRTVNSAYLLFWLPLRTYGIMHKLRRLFSLIISVNSRPSPASPRPSPYVPVTRASYPEITTTPLRHWRSQQGAIGGGGGSRVETTPTPLYDVRRSVFFFKVPGRMSDILLLHLNYIVRENGFDCQQFDRQYGLKMPTFFFNLRLFFVQYSPSDYYFPSSTPRPRRRVTTRTTRTPTTTPRPPSRPHLSPPVDSAWWVPPVTCSEAAKGPLYFQIGPAAAHRGNQGKRNNKFPYIFFFYTY